MVKAGADLTFGGKPRVLDLWRPNASPARRCVAATGRSLVSARIELGASSPALGGAGGEEVIERDLVGRGRGSASGSLRALSMARLMLV